MPGVRDSGALASCVAQPKTAVFGEERFPTVFDKAAAYCFFIVRMHPFFDGNKRTGLVAAITFLLDHGISPEFDQNEMYDVMIRVANGQIEIDELAQVFCRTGRRRA
jgi:death-on-curing protein